MTTAVAPPAAPTPAADATLPGLLVQRARERPGEVALQHKDLGIWKTVTWRRYLDAVELAAHGYLALGVTAGDRVAIHSENRPEWLYADLGAESVGAIVTGIYPTNPAPEVGYLLQDSGVRVLVAEDQEQVDKALQVIDDCPSLDWIVAIDPKGMRAYDHPKLLTYAHFLERGQAHRAANPQAFDDAVAARRHDEIACIVYTSGTTGPPKGAMLTHRNCLVGATAFLAGMGDDGRASVLSYLPLCHVAERTSSIFVALLAGNTVSFAESADTVQHDLYEIAPSYFAAVPRIAEKMQSGVEIKMRDAAWLKRENYRLWMSVGRRIARRRLDAGGRLGVRDRVAYAVGNVLLYAALRERLGLKNVRMCALGAAPPAPELLEYFHAIGIRTVQLYGQTECGGASHMHQGWDIAYDTVGALLPGYDCRIDADTSEVLLAGEGVFAGYWGNDAATAATVRDGWLHTGDQGVVDDAGQLKIIGRLKDIIITSGGKNISPDYIENQLKFSPYVREAVVIGDGRKYLGALIGIELDTVGHWAEQRGIPYTTYRDLVQRPEVGDLIGGWVREVNDQLAQVEQIKRFRLIPKELDHEDAELTATQKVRRAAVAEKFDELVAELFS